MSQKHFIYFGKRNHCRWCSEWKLTDVSVPENKFIFILPTGCCGMNVFKSECNECIAGSGIFVAKNWSSGRKCVIFILYKTSFLGQSIRQMLYSIMKTEALYSGNSPPSPETVRYLHGGWIVQMHDVEKRIEISYVFISDHVKFYWFAKKKTNTSSVQFFNGFVRRILSGDTVALTLNSLFIVLSGFP